MGGRPPEAASRTRSLTGDENREVHGEGAGGARGGAREAQERGQQAIEIEHLLLALLRQSGGIAPTLPARALLAERGWDPNYGARPLKRTIQRMVADVLARMILEGRFQDGDRVVVDVENGELQFRKGARLEAAAPVRA